MSLLRVQRKHSDETWKQTDQILSGVFTEEIMEKMTFSSHLWSRQARRTKLNDGKWTGWSGLNQQIQAQRNQDGLSDIHLILGGVTLEPWALPLGRRPEGLLRWQPATRALTGSQRMQAGGSHLHTRQSGRGQTQHIKPCLAYSRCSLNATFCYYMVTG